MAIVAERVAVAMLAQTVEEVTAEVMREAATGAEGGATVDGACGGSWCCAAEMPRAAAMEVVFSLRQERKHHAQRDGASSRPQGLRRGALCAARPWRAPFRSSPSDRVLTKASAATSRFCGDHAHKNEKASAATSSRFCGDHAHKNEKVSAATSSRFLWGSCPQK